MNEQRTQAYLTLIQQLLQCNSGQEAEVLNANRELVDAGLVQIMIQSAEVLRERGDRNGADFLIYLARQLAELLGSSENVTADNSSPEATLEEYLDFLMQLLWTTTESKVDPDVVYPILKRNLDKLDEVLAIALQSWATLTLKEAESEKANTLATVVFSFSNLIQQFGSPDFLV